MHTACCPAWRGVPATTRLPAAGNQVTVAPTTSQKLPMGPGRGLVLTGRASGVTVEMRVGGASSAPVGVIKLDGSALPHRVLVPYECQATVTNDDDGGEGAEDVVCWTEDLAATAGPE